MKKNITLSLLSAAILTLPAIALAQTTPLNVASMPVIQETRPDANMIISSLIKTLAQGTRNNSVKTLQTALASDAAIYPEGYVTGYYGPLTAKAVARFKIKFGVNPALPVISKIATSSTANSVTVSWSTDKPTRSKVWFGSVTPTDTALNPLSSSILENEHSATFTGGLATSTNYYFVIGATDLIGNFASSSQGTFKTLAK